MEIDNIIEEKKNNSESELDIKDHKMKIDNTIEEKDDIFEDIDELLRYNIIFNIIIIIFLKI